MTEPTEAGFCGDCGCLVYVAPSGCAWLLATEDDLPVPRKLRGLPRRLESLPELMDTEEAAEYLRRIERVERDG
jgi:hypothetical protein